MIFIDNISFLYVIAFIFAYNLARQLTSNKIFLNLLLILGSVTVLTTVSNLSSIGGVLIISLLVFLGGILINRQTKFKRGFLYILVSALIILFIIKNYQIADFSLVQRIGLSYILFRLIHFLIDSSRGKIHDNNLLSFLNYIIFFPTFIAGPIDEYNNFNYWINQKRKNYNILLVKAGLFKLILGIFKKFFIVPIVINYSLDFSLLEADFSWQVALLISLFFYSLYILFDFSGYSDIAIGTAYLIGIKTPENFDNPYFSKNLSIFWKKWHMTFSNFLFKYVFKPTVTNLSKILKKFPRLTVTFLGYLITFTICGIWHGNTWNFVYWGIWHGIGLIFFKLWDIYIYKNYFKGFTSEVVNRFYILGSVIITFVFVSLGWFFFNYQTNDVSFIIKNLNTSNHDQVEVSTVIYKDKPCVKIDFSKSGFTSEYIDIEYKSSSQDSLIKYYDIAMNDSNVYFLFPETTIKDLFLIRIRSKDVKNEGPWNTVLSYLDEKNIEQSVIQKMLFGKVFPATKVTNISTKIIGENLYLPRKLIDQELDPQVKFIPNYGWAIQINYLPYPENLVQIEYKTFNHDWITTQSKRDGKYNFVHIHGHTRFNKTDRNLDPGNYEIRIKYIKGHKSSEWLYGSITIPNYVDRKEDY